MYQKVLYQGKRSGIFFDKGYAGEDEWLCILEVNEICNDEWIPVEVFTCKLEEMDTPAYDYILGRAIALCIAIDEQGEEQ